jgi:LPS export ABC transporter protein LptC
VSQPATPRRFLSHRLLRRPALLALLPLLPLMGCGGGSKPRREEVVPPFVFRSLNLRQQTPTGKPAWELTSPEARYDLRRRIAQAISPKGVIYAAGRPLYRVQADSGTVVNDGEVILLEGSLRVERIGRDPVLIQASRARWLPRQQLMLIDRRPVAWDRLGRLRAERARFLFQEDRLELTGQPQLDRWNQRFDPFTALPTIPPAIVVQAAAVRWKPGSGELQADGPLIGQRIAGTRRHLGLERRELLL